MKKKLFVGALVGLATLPMTVYAGTSTVKFEGQTNVNVGDEFKVNMVIDNVVDANGGVEAFGGFISFDNNVLQIVGTESTGNYDVMINENINKIAAIDFTGNNGIYNRTNVYTITFKAIGEGNTAVTLRNGELCDVSSNLDFTVESLDVNAKNVVVETPVTTNNVTYEQPTYVKNTEENIVNNETTERVEETTVENKEDKKVKKIVNKTKKKSKKTKKVNKKNGFFEFFINIFNKIFNI